MQAAYNIVLNEMVIPFDVDKTLVLPPTEFPDAPAVSLVIENPYTQKLVRRLIHRPHRNLLVNYLSRGAFVIVWSKNGPRWAREVLRALGIKPAKNLILLNKPFAHVDDQCPTTWMGEHINMDPSDSFGED